MLDFLKKAVTKAEEAAKGAASSVTGLLQKAAANPVATAKPLASAVLRTVAPGVSLTADLVSRKVPMIAKDVATAVSAKPAPAPAAPRQTVADFLSATPQNAASTPAVAQVAPMQIRKPFGTNEQTFHDPLITEGYPFNLLADAGGRLLELIPKVAVQTVQNLRATKAGLSGNAEPDANLRINPERLGFSTGKVESTGKKLFDRYAELEKQNPSHVEGQAAGGYGQQTKNAALAVLDTVIPDAFDAVFAGDLVNAGAKGLLTATKFNPELDRSLALLGLERGVTGEAARDRVVAIGRELAAKGDTEGLRQYNQAVQTVLGAAAKDPAAVTFRLNRVGQTLQDVATALTDPIGGRPPLPRPLGDIAPEQALPGYRPATPTGRPAPAVGLQVQPYERVGGEAPRVPKAAPDVEEGLKIAEQSMATQREVVKPEFLQDKIVYRDPQGAIKVMDRDAFEGTKDTSGALIPGSNTPVEGTVEAVLKTDGTVTIGPEQQAPAARVAPTIAPKGTVDQALANDINELQGQYLDDQGDGENIDPVLEEKVGTELGKAGYTFEVSDMQNDIEIGVKTRNIKEAQKKLADLAEAMHPDIQVQRNDDGTITLYHGTDPEAAKAILKDGFDGGGGYFSSSIAEEVGGVNGAGYYGDTILEARVDPRMVKFSATGEFTVDGGIKSVRIHDAGAVVDQAQQAAPIEEVAKVSPRAAKIADDLVSAEEISSAVEAQRRGTIPHPELVAQASKIPVSIRDLANLKPGTVVTPAKAQAYSEALNGYRTIVRQLRENSMAAPDDLVLKEQYDYAAQQYARAKVNLAAIRSEYGRGLEATKIQDLHSRIPFVNENIDKVRSRLKPEQQAVFDKAIEAVDMDDPKAALDFLKKWYKPGAIAKIMEYYRASLLSAFTTQAVNAMGNFIALNVEIANRGLAGTLDTARAALTNTERQVYAREAAQMFGQAFRSLPEATVHALHAIADEDYQASLRRAFQESGSQLPAIKGFKGKVIRVPFRFLSAMDLFFRTLNENMNMESLIYRKAAQEGLTGTELAARISELKLNPPLDLIEEVGRRTDRALYQEPLEGIMKSFATFKNKHPVLQFVIPFYQTMVNLSREAYRMTPLRLINVARGKDAWWANPNTRMEEISRMIMGTAVAAALTIAIVEKKLEVTGAAPSDPEERDAFYGQGKLPYAVKMGNHWVQYQKVQPFSTILFLSSKLADAYNVYEEKGTVDEKQVTDDANSLASETSRFILDQSAFTGLSSFLQFINGGQYGQGVIDQSTDYFGGFLGGFIPNALFSYTRANDPTVYKTDTISENLRSRIPGLQGDLPVRRDLTGEPVERSGTFLTRLLSPVGISEVKNDPFYNAIEQNGASPTFPSKTAFGHKLSDEEYSTLQQYVGPKVRAQVGALMLDPKFQALPEIQQDRLISKVNGAIKEEGLNVLFPHYLYMQKIEQALQLKGYSQVDAAREAERMLNYSQENAAAGASQNYEKARAAGSTIPTISEMLGKRP